MKQVWFPGVHSDVGGGYPELESGLAKIALKWMIDEAEAAGLLMKQDTIDLILGQLGQPYVAPNPDACLHNSLTRWWQPAELLPKPHWNQKTHQREWRANYGNHRTWPPDPIAPVIHDAAWQRHNGAYAQTLPANAIRLNDAERTPGLTPEFGVVRS